MTAFYFGQTTNVSRILALEAISLMSHFTLVEVAHMGDNSEFHSARSGPKGDFTLVIRRSTKVKFVILNAKASERRLFFGHSPFGQGKLRHSEVRAYSPRQIQRSTNVDVALFEK